MSNESTMECPFCGRKALLKKEKKEREFRGNRYLITESYYFCEKCNEPFSTTELDEINIQQIYNQYRDEGHCHEW